MGDDSTSSILGLHQYVQRRPDGSDGIEETMLRLVPTNINKWQCYLIHPRKKAKMQNVDPSGAIGRYIVALWESNKNTWAPGRCPTDGTLLTRSAGRWNAVEGASRCTDCPLGRASDVLGATDEAVCEAGENADSWFFMVMTSIAMENDPFIVDLPIKNGDFP